MQQAQYVQLRTQADIEEGGPSEWRSAAIGDHMAVGCGAETLMEAAERQILQIQYARSLREPPWDGQLPR